MFLIFGESFEPFTIKMLAMGLSPMAFIMLKYVPSIPNLLHFYHGRMLNLPNTFYASIEMILIFLFHSVNVVNCTDLHMLNHSFNPGITPT